MQTEIRRRLEFRISRSLKTIRGVAMNRKSIKSLMLSFVLLLSPFMLFCEPAGIPEGINIYDYVKLGETAWAIRYYDYWNAVADTAKARIDEHRALLTKIKANEKTLAAFDKFMQLVNSMPVSTPWMSLTEEQRNTWKNTPGWDPFFASLKENVTDPDATFFLWIGLESLRLGWTIAKYQADNWTVAELLPEVRPGIEDFVWITNQKTFSSLRPNIQSSIQIIAAMKTKDADPLGEGITMADIKKMIQASQSIRQAAKEQQLVQ